MSNDMDMSQERADLGFKTRLTGLFVGNGFRAQLIRGGIGSLGVKGSYVLLQLALGIILARILGPSGYGAFAFALALVGVLVIPAQFGFPSFLVRMCAIYSDHKQYDLLKGLLNRAKLLVLFFSVSFACLGALVFSIFGVPQDMGLEPLLLAMLLLSPLALIAVNGGALRGLGFVVLGQVPAEIIRPAFFLLAIYISILVSDLSLNKSSVICLNIVATWCAFMVGSLFFAKHKPETLSIANSTFETRSWLRQSLPFMLLSGTQLLNHQADILVLGMLAGAEITGLYRVAVQVVDALGMVLVAVSMVIAPHLARLHARRDWTLIQKTMIYSHRISVVFLLLPAMFLLIYGHFIIIFIFGEIFIESSRALSILVIGKLLHATVIFSATALSMFGHASISTFVIFVSVIVNVLLNLLLIPVWGIEGAAFATASSSLLSGVICVFYMYFLYGLDFSFIGLKDRKIKGMLGCK